MSFSSKFWLINEKKYQLQESQRWNSVFFFTEFAPEQIVHKIKFKSKIAQKYAKLYYIYI